MTLKAKMLTGAMEAEAALAKESASEFDETIDSLPDDSPLKQNAIGMKKLMGDLSGLPPGHPLLMAMEEARARYEAEEAAKRQAEGESEAEAEAEEAKLKKAKRLDEKKAAREARNRQEEKHERQRNAAKNINSSMAEAMDTLKRLNDNIEACRDDFAGDRYAQMKLDRLQRVLLASMRGLADSKLNPGRMTNG